MAQVRMNFVLRTLGILLLTAVCRAGAQDTNAPAAGSIAYLDYRYGYRNVHFGMSSSDLPESLAPFTSGGIKFYACTKEDDAVGGTKPARPMYGFYKDQLASVNVVMDDKDDFEAWMRVLTAAYGPPSTLADGRYQWTGKRVLLVASPFVNGTASFQMQSIPIFKQKQADEAAAAAGGAQGL